jgi:hypothetical protein
VPAENDKARGERVRNSKNIHDVNTKTSKPDSRQKMVSSIKLKADIRLSDSAQHQVSSKGKAENQARQDVESSINYERQ